MKFIFKMKERGHIIIDYGLRMDIVKIATDLTLLGEED